ncbi:MAG TPA: YceI family protein [bacterium]|nr:YceI family protein [bacterium]
MTGTRIGLFWRLAAAAVVAGVLCAVEEPAVLPAAAAPTAAVPAGGFAIVPGESSVTFAVPDNRGGFSGHTTQVSGRVEVAPAAGETYTARITGLVDARSLTTANAVRDNAMHTTFLQTGTYPTVAFAGTATARPGLGVRAFPTTVHGQLTIRNVTRETEFTAAVVALGKEYVADATATVRMAEYGIPYPRAFIFVARDPVTVTLHIVARAP